MANGRAIHPASAVVPSIRSQPEVRPSSLPFGLSWRLTRALLHRPIGANHPGIVAAAILDYAALGRVVHVDDAEAFGVALGPLEIVEEGPDEVAAERRTLGDCLPGGAEMIAQVGDPF